MENKEFKLNINSSIRVKLNDYGYKILADCHNKYLGFLHKGDERTPDYYKGKVDTEGYTNFQIWDFIQIFGEYTRMGLKIPYETDILIKKIDLNPKLENENSN